jgi:hypothetical protein
MSHASDSSAPIFEGFWVNWSKGRLRGLTLTPSPTNATLLTNALAMFVTVCGGQLWTILRFAIHQLFSPSSKAKRRSILHNKQQVILRNTSTALETARRTASLTWSSRKDITIFKSLTLILLATVYATFFMTAATFSNRMVNAGQTVLLDSPYCGPWNQTYLDMAGFGLNAESAETLLLSEQYLLKLFHDVQLSLEYAQQCYLSGTTSPPSSSCDMSQTYFPKQRLGLTISHEQSCPFSSDLCSADAPVIVVSQSSSPTSVRHRWGLEAKFGVHRRSLICDRIARR